MPEDGTRLEDRFEAYIASLTGVFGHADRVGPLHDYCSGLLLPMERKSVEPMATVLAPSRTSAKHQSLLHFVGQGGWSDSLVLSKIRDLVLPALQRDEAAVAWIVDDTGIAKKGVHSVGVARQYCGRLGKQDSCQVAVSLSVANHSASLPIAYRLFLPQIWANDPDRRAKVGIPADVTFQSKPQIALDQIQCALAEGVPRGVVLADAGYGNGGMFRAALTEAGLPYVVAIQSNATFWPPGQDPLPAKAWTGCRRPAVRLHRSPQHAPLSAAELAINRRADFSTVTWREGSNADLTSRFAAFRVRPAARDNERIEPHPVEWLLTEWPEGEDEPTKYWLSTLPEATDLTTLVDRAKLRFRIGRDYEELKSELGLAQFEGRGWRGFHHHATLTIAAYGFLIRERAAFPPSAVRIRKELAISARPRPRGAPTADAAPHPKLNRNHP
ncbi:IS701 family transposase [Rhizobium leguminosarum]|uniref:IS701 family transposase n=1 Tax=Rhizobium leguminosarum TaxID=384 RepID=UPI0010321B1F|nr:IS701 family transposase [Rhizobium leguminosarum]TAU72992.1 IS701 family transposase [Rhizobium leguminosarum]TAV40675.1 IS701 family transposase [Rhizobium leguminosarum]